MFVLCLLMLGATLKIYKSYPLTEPHGNLEAGVFTCPHFPRGETGAGDGGMELNGQSWEATAIHHRSQSLTSSRLLPDCFSDRAGCHVQSRP